MFDESFWAALAFIIFMLGASKTIKTMLIDKIDARAKKIEEDIEEAAYLKKEAETYYALSQKSYLEAKDQVNDILLHAEREADRLRKEAIHHIKEMKAIEERLLLDRIALVEKQAIKDIEEKAVKIALATTARVIEKNNTLDKEKMSFMKTLEKIKSIPDFLQR